jgi:hypothetical protein
MIGQTPLDLLLAHPDVELRYDSEKPDQLFQVFAEFCVCGARKPLKQPACVECGSTEPCDVILYWTASKGLTRAGEELLDEEEGYFPSSAGTKEETEPVVVVDLLPLVPEEMKSYKNWVTFDSDNLVIKAPFVSGFTSRHAKSNNPNTWVTYQTACANIAAGKGYTGLGFVADGANTGNITGIDIDACRNSKDGSIADWAQKVLECAGSTYVEVTVSGNGLRAWVVAEISENKKFYMKSETSHPSGKAQAVEVFSDARYFTVSGNKLPDAPSEIAKLDKDRVATLFALLDSLKAEDKFDKPEKKSPRTKAVSKNGTVVFEEVPPDEGFKKLYEAVGWKPLEDRMHQMDDARFHGIFIKPGQLSFCPMPYGSHTNRGGSNWVPCFGEMAKLPGVVHCFGCDFSGDLIKAVRTFDGRDENMYDTARRICQEEGLNFQDFFPPKEIIAAAVQAAATQATKAAVTQIPLGFRVQRMDEIGPLKLGWLWTHRIPKGKITTIAGDPDKGKSLITLYLASVVSTGGSFYDDDKVVEPGEVVILSAEDDPEDTLVPRLKAAGADLSKIYLIHSTIAEDERSKSPKERQVQLDSDVRELYKMLRDNPRIKLVIIDPVSSFLGKANMCREQEVRAALEPLRRAVGALGVTFVQVAHLNKNSETRSAIDRVGGAKAIVGLGRAAWLCLPFPDDTDHPEEDVLTFVKLKGNLAPSKIGGLKYVVKTRPVEVFNKETDQHEMVEQPYIEWVGKTDGTAQSLLIDGPNSGSKESKTETKKETKKADAAQKWLHTYMTEIGGAETVEKIVWDAAGFGHTKRVIERAKKELGLETKRYGGPDWYWLVPGFDDSQLTLDGKPTKGKHGGSRSKSGRKSAAASNVQRGLPQVDDSFASQVLRLDFGTVEKLCHRLFLPPFERPPPECGP